MVPNQGCWFNPMGGYEIGGGGTKKRGEILQQKLHKIESWGDRGRGVLREWVGVKWREEKKSGNF